MADISELKHGLDRVPLPGIGGTTAAKLVKSRPDDGKKSQPSRRQSLKRALHIGKDHSQQLSAIPTAIPTQADVQASYEEKTESRRLNSESTESQEPSTFSKIVHDPIDTTKSLIRGRVAEELSSNLLVAEVPHHHNVELLQSHAAISEAPANDSKQQDDATDRRDMLLRAQQKEFLLWTLDRHVKRVKVVEADSTPSDKDQESKSKNAGDMSPSTTMDQKQYLEHLLVRFAHRYGSHCIGYGTYPPPLSQDVLTSIAERILVVSMPVQHLATTLRWIYRWEDPYATAACFLLYLLLWSTGLLSCATLFVTVLFVLTRYGKPPSFDDLRSELNRIEDASRQSRSITEFATKQGDRQDWLTPLGDALGPAFLVQLGDLASFLEILQNFYEWRNPERTAISVVWLAALAIITAGMPSWLLVKSFTLSCGLIFFLCFPISSHYPDYRLIVSPKTWLFWKIPTHAEWAIAVVQTEARQAQEGIDPNSDSVKIARHSCHWEHSRGSLVVTNHDISFSPASLLLDSGWKIDYAALQSMEKRERHTHSRSGEDIQFTMTSGMEYVVKDVEGRDEVFVQIIGHARLTWLPQW